MGRELLLHPFLISALNAMSGQFHGPFALMPVNKTPVQFVYLAGRATALVALVLQDMSLPLLGIEPFVLAAAWLV